MATLRTTYMGIEIRNPLVVGASGLTSNLDTIKRLEDAGAGAYVIKSLFEEQIQFRNYQLDQSLHLYDDWHAEMTSIFPNVQDPGPEEHLMWVRKAKESSSIPVIASLNAVGRETWVEWAKMLEQTGVDGLELYFFSLPNDADECGADIEAEQLAALRAVRAEIRIPICVKISPFYTNILNFVQTADALGLDGFVLFNRPFEPSIDVEREKGDMPFNLSSPNDHRLALRFIGLLSGKIKADLCASNGIHSAAHAVEMFLAGAKSFQVVSFLYRNSLAAIKTMLEEISAWMDRKGYKCLEDFRGRLDAERNPDKLAYRRAQYVKVLMRPSEYLQRPRVI